MRRMLGRVPTPRMLRMRDRMRIVPVLRTDHRVRTWEITGTMYRVHRQLVERSMARRTARSRERMFPRIPRRTMCRGRRPATTASRVAMAAANNQCRLRMARSRATLELRRPELQRCTVRRRTTAITLRAERRNSRLRRISRRRHNMRRRRATRTATAAAARTAAAQAQRRGRTARRLGHLRTTPITLRQRTPVLRRTLRDVPASAPTAEAVATPPVRTTAPAGARIRARAYSARSYGSTPSYSARSYGSMGSSLRRTTRLRITRAEAVRLHGGGGGIPAVVVDTPAVVDIGNFLRKRLSIRSGLQRPPFFCALRTTQL